MNDIRFVVRQLVPAVEELIRTDRKRAGYILGWAAGAICLEVARASRERREGKGQRKHAFAQVSNSILKAKHGIRLSKSANTSE